MRPDAADGRRQKAADGQRMASGRASADGRRRTLTTLLQWSADADEDGGRCDGRTTVVQRTASDRRSAAGCRTPLARQIWPRARWISRCRWRTCWVSR
ncbi:hypothetical protein ACLOJK_013490 [Asimina triloba]